MRNIRVKGTRSEVIVEVDGVQVIRHPLGKNFEYEVTRQDIEMLTERAATAAMAEADEAVGVSIDLEVDADAAEGGFAGEFCKLVAEDQEREVARDQAQERRIAGMVERKVAEENAPPDPEDSDEYGD